MYEAIYNLKHNRKKGFTLVELIVVLVILAILLAILVPSMTGWITKAKEKQILTSARAVYLACQTVSSEDFAKTTPAICGQSEQKGTVTDKNVAASSDPACIGSVAALAGVNTAYSITFAADPNGNLTKFEYTVGSQKVSLNTTDKTLEISKVTG